MKTKLNSFFVMPHLPFATLALLAVFLAAMPGHAQSNYWGYGLSFNGASSYVSFGVTPPLSKPWTAEFWVNRQDSSNTAAALLDDGVTSLRLEQFNGTKRVGFTKYGAADYVFNYTAPTNTWVHLAFVSDATHTYLYVNGVVQDTNANTISLPLRQFGAVTNGAGASSSAMKGLIDEIRIWNVARSATNIQADLAQPLTNTLAGLVAYWKFDEGTGTNTYDAAANHHDGVLVNGPAWAVSLVPGPFIYTTNDGAITITGYIGPGGPLAIPGTICGLPVTRIEDSAFWGCASLTSLTIPDSVTSIGDYAFFQCSSLTNISISSGVISIRGEAFAYCDSLISITVDADNPAYCSVDGVLFDKNRTRLVKCPGAKTGSYTVPAGVTSIGEWAFDAGSLTSVIIPNTVTNIGDFAFADCYNLTSVTLPNGITSIGYCEFVNSYNLRSITIPAAVTSIADYAFARCDGLREIYFQGNAPTLGVTRVFYGENPTVYFCPGTTGWETFNANSGLSPAVLWNAQVQTGGTFGVRTNRFGFTITGTANIPIAVDACTNPASAAWTRIQTCTLTNGFIYFCDPQWTNCPARFYRVRWP